MPLYKRGSVWWLDYTDERGRRVRVSTRSRDRNAASMIEADVLRAVEMRRAGVMIADAAAARKPIVEVVEQYVGDLDQRGEHARICRWRLLRAVEDCRWQTAADISPETISLHLDGLRGKGRTRNQVRQVIGAWCAWMMTRRPPLIAANPIDHVARAAESRDPMRWPLGDAEFEALVGHTGKGNWAARRLVYLLAGEAGMRRGEIEHLVAARVRLDGVAPFIELPADTTKARRWQQVLLTPRLAEALRAAVGAVEPLDRVCPRVPMTATLRADLAAAGVDPHNATGMDVDLHSLRHTFVARLVRQGVPLETVRMLARHRDVSTTTRIYGQLGLSDAAAGIATLSGRGGSGGGGGGVTAGVTDGVPNCAVSVPSWQRGRQAGAG